MKIIGIFLAQEIRTGGHVRYLELMESIGENHSVTVFFNPESGYVPRRFSIVPVPLRYNRSGFVPRSFIFSSAVRKTLSSSVCNALEAPDAVLIFGESHLSSAKLLVSHFSCPLVFAYRSNSVRETFMKLKEPGRSLFARFFEACRLVVYRAYEIEVARVSSLIVFQSAFDESDYLRRNPKASGLTGVVRGDMCQPRFRKEYACGNSSSSPIPLVFIGNLGVRKGLRYLVAALIELRERGLSPKLDVLGDGYDPLISLTLTSAGMEGQVSFHGKVANPFPYLRDAGLLVVPSIFDSYPNVILEALHAGCPVIGTAVGGIPEMLGNPSLLFPARDSHALANVLESLCTDTSVYQRLKNICSERRAYFMFDWALEWMRVIGASVVGGRN